ncbi:MAG: integrase core domain-containing protein, partial [Clostridia bacterium]
STTSKSKKKATVNNDDIPNVLNREFSEKTALEVVVSDLTYVKVDGKWNYICLLLDLSNRKIIGSAVGKNKDAKLVQTAFFSVQSDLRRIKLFHTDRGSEFKNEIVESILNAFNIARSLSHKGTPVDNSVAESMYNIVKREFANREFQSLHQLEILWFDFVNWYNNIRIHGTLGYLAPSEFEKRNLIIEKL